MPDKNHYARCLFSMPDASKLCQIWHTLCQVETTEKRPANGRTDQQTDRPTVNYEPHLFSKTTYQHFLFLSFEVQENFIRGLYPEGIFQKT